MNEFLALLASRRVEFVVVGGHAFHGYPRTTGDIDLLVRPSPGNAQNLLLALSDFGFRNLDLTVDDLTTAGRVVQLGRPPNRIDLLTSISGVEFEEAWSSRVEGRLGEHEVSFLDGTP